MRALRFLHPLDPPQPATACGAYWQTDLSHGTLPVARTEAVKPFSNAEDTVQSLLPILCRPKREVHLPKGLFLTKKGEKEEKGVCIAANSLNFVYFIFLSQTL